MFILEEKYLLNRKPNYVYLSFLRPRLGVSGLTNRYRPSTFSINTITADIRDKSCFLSANNYLAGHG